MRETVHNMKLQDAIHRQNIRKIERTNKKLDAESRAQEETLTGYKKQAATDE